MQICRCCPIPETGRWVTSCISIGPYANAIHDKGPIIWKDAPVFFFPLGFYSEARRQMKWLLDRVHLLALLWVYGAVGGIPVCRPFLKCIYFFIFFPLRKQHKRGWARLPIEKTWRWGTSVCATCAELMTHPGWIIGFSPYECWDRFQNPLWAWLGITCSYQKHMGWILFVRTTAQISSAHFKNSPLSKI